MPRSSARIRQVLFTRALQRSIANMHGIVGHHHVERLLIFGTFFQEIARGLRQTENAFRIIQGNGSLVCRLPPVAVAIAVGMFVVEVGDIVPMILEPMHRRAALAKESGDIALVRLL